MSYVGSIVAILGLVLACVSFAVTIMAYFVKFLYGRTTGLENNIDGIEDKIDTIAGELRQAMQSQSSDHRLAQGNIWTELRRMGNVWHSSQSAAAEVMTRNQLAIVEAMGKLATRDEVERAHHSMESRMMDMIRKEIINR